MHKHLLVQRVWCPINGFETIIIKLKQMQAVNNPEHAVQFNTLFPVNMHLLMNNSSIADTNSRAYKLSWWTDLQTKNTLFAQQWWTTGLPWSDLTCRNHQHQTWADQRSTLDSCKPETSSPHSVNMVICNLHIPLHKSTQIVELDSSSMHHQKYTG